MIPIFPKLNASVFATSALFAAKPAAQFLFSPVVAGFVDKHSMLLLMVGLVLESCSTLVFAFTFDYGYWLAARGCQGVCSALIMSSAFLRVQQLHQNDDAGLGISMGIVTTGIYGGYLIGPPIGGVLFDLAHWIPFITCSTLIGMVFGLACVLHATTKADQAFRSSLGGIIPTTEADDKSLSQKVCGLMSDKHIVVTLLALFCANGAQACIESTLGQYLEDTKDLSATQVGLIFISCSAPGLLCAKLSGSLGNRFGRWKIILIGMIIEGLFFALGPKELLWIEIISLFGMGAGMGLVDGCIPALLAQVSSMSHGGTGVVYSLQNAAIQLGFVFGPMVGSTIYESTSFQIMSIALGAFMVSVAPLMLFNKDLPLADTELSACDDDSEVHHPCLPRPPLHLRNSDDSLP